MDTLMGALDGITVTDNLLGDITDFLEMDFETLEENEKTLRMKVSYASTDLCGNQAVAEQTLEMNVGGLGQWMTPGNTSSSSSVAEGYHQDMARELFDYANQARVAEGLSPLTWDSTLENTALIRVEEIVISFNAEHTRPNGQPWHTVAERYTVNGENCSRYGVTAAITHEGFMNSPGHRANILYSDFTRGGFSCLFQNGGFFWVEDFAF